jgi:hypothetical protein
MFASLCAHLMLKRTQDIYRGLVLTARSCRLRCLDLARECIRDACIVNQPESEAVGDVGDCALGSH